MLRLKQILREKKLKQLFVSKALNTSPVTFSNWVTGKSMPSVETLIRLAEFLDVSLDELVVQKKVKNNHTPHNI